MPAAWARPDSAEAAQLCYCISRMFHQDWGFQRHLREALHTPGVGAGMHDPEKVMHGAVRVGANVGLTVRGKASSGCQGWCWASPQMGQNVL